MNHIFDDLLTEYRGHRLEHSDYLSWECKLHCKWMAEFGKREHSPYPHKGECIAEIPYAHNPDYIFFEMWKNSPAHNDILLADAKMYGIWFYASYEKIYATFRIA